MHIIDSITGLPHANNVIVFNGDMVDRGSNSCEIFLAVCALKVHAPKYVAVNRGNHEAFGMGVHGFTNEALGKYDMETYELFQHCFRVLPLVRFFTFASCASPTLACPRAYIVAVSFFFANRQRCCAGTQSCCTVAWVTGMPCERRRSSVLVRNRSLFLPLCRQSLLIRVLQRDAIWCNR